MYRKNTAGQYVYFALVNATNGAALTGATVTAYRALDNGAQASATGTTTELANGQYRFNLSQADTNADYGSYLFTATNAVPVEKTVVFTAADPTDAIRFGLTSLPNVADRLLISASAQRTVAVTGSNHVAADIHELQPAVISSGDFAAGALNDLGNWLKPTVAGRTINVAATGGVYVSGDMFGNSLVIPNLATQSQIPAEFTSATFASTGVFAASALVNAPSSGGADWSANERTAIRSILGFDAGGTVSLPTVGVMDAIKDKTDLITAGQVQYISPVSPIGNIATPIFAGDDYKASIGNAFAWTINARTGYSVSTATCRFGGLSEDTGDSWSVSGTVSDLGGGQWRLSFDMPKATTSTLSPGFYRWSVELVNPGGDEVTEVYNSNANRQVEVRAKQT